MYYSCGCCIFSFEVVEIYFIVHVLMILIRGMGMQGTSSVLVQSPPPLKGRDNELSESDEAKGKRLFQLHNFNWPELFSNFNHWTRMTANSFVSNKLNRKSTVIHAIGIAKFNHLECMSPSGCQSLVV